MEELLKSRKFSYILALNFISDLNPCLAVTVIISWSCSLSFKTSAESQQTKAGGGLQSNQ